MIGDIVFARFPLADQSRFKLRPCLVVTAADHRGDLDVLKITSKGLDLPGRISIGPEDFLKGGLDRPCAVVTTDLAKTNVAALARYVGQLKPGIVQSILKTRIQSATQTYSRLAHPAQRPGTDPLRAPFHPGSDVVPYAGRVFDEDEVTAAVSTTLDFWLTLGKEGEAFETELAAFLGVRRSLLTNSGSSANLLAFSALTSHKLPPEKRIRPGDEVITCAAGFPTTVAPILQNHAVPVFIDNHPITGNADLSRLEDAYVPGKTKAVMMAHALGNPFDLATVLAFCRKHDLWLIEDNCDALGCTYSMPVELARKLKLDHLLKIAESGTHPMIRFQKAETLRENQAPRTKNDEHLAEAQLVLTAPTGVWGDLSTQSFYPPHHLTMGEGGAINIVRDMKLKVLVESFRDWGRDCWCASGVDNTCKKRFGWQLGELPEGYDHKYIYSHLGYNLKPLDPQAAIGRAQLRKMAGFVDDRKRNWQALRSGLAGLEDVFEFALPTHATGWNPDGSFQWDGSGRRTDCSWFGFLMLVRPEAPFTRTELVRHLDAKKIGNRMLFGGNLVRQPAFVQLCKDQPGAFRIVGSAQGKTGSADPADSRALPGADRIMNQAVFIGVYPGLTAQMISYMVETIRHFVDEARTHSTASHTGSS